MSKNLIGLLLFVVAIALSFGYLVPEMRELRTITTEKKARETIVANKKQRKEDLQKLTATFSSQSARIASIISTLPQEPDIPEVLVSIEAMAAQSGVSVLSLVPQVNAKEQVVTMTLQGEGDLGAAERLMQAIQDNNRPMSISRLSMTRKQDSNRLAFTMSLSLPYIPASKTR